ncbi:DUF6415 family natural product biosynthesis protein [Streptomyces sp. NPDC086519]|uniref:DUF6415 family natural product biosynthesis protein n=1 Tax=Streptomyces sp. NPDC086519 TaxID=3154863 RepID=UPI00344AFB31
MRHATVHPPTAEGQDQAPPDITTMRATANRLLALDAKPIKAEELDTLRLALRGHIELMIPEVERLAGSFAKGDVSRECALAGVREARMRLGLRPGFNSPGQMTVAMKLARSVNALCDHYRILGGAPTTGA